MEWISVLWTVANIATGEMIPVALAAAFAAALCGWQHQSDRQHRRRIAEIEHRIALRKGSV